MDISCLVATHWCHWLQSVQFVLWWHHLYRSHLGQICNKCIQLRVKSHSLVIKCVWTTSGILCQCLLFSHFLVDISWCSPPNYSLRVWLNNSECLVIDQTCDFFSSKKVSKCPKTVVNYIVVAIITSSDKTPMFGQQMVQRNSHITNQTLDFKKSYHMRDISHYRSERSNFITKGLLFLHRLVDILFHMQKIYLWRRMWKFGHSILKGGNLKLS